MKQNYCTQHIFVLAKGAQELRAGWTINDSVLGGPKLKKMEFLSVVDFLFDVCLPTMALLPTTLAGLSELGAGARGGHMSPQFVADYLNLSQPGE